MIRSFGATILGGKNIHSRVFQVILLSVWSFLFVAPMLSRTGTNIVTNTYAEGAERIWNGDTPYAPATVRADVFHYPPFFAFAYRPFTYLKSVPQSLIWAFLNCLFFWSGVTAFFKVRRNMGIWMWAALACCAMELDISLRWQQCNALLIGLILIAVAHYKNSRFATAAVWLAFGANLKIIPGLVALALLPRSGRRFAIAFVAALVVFFLLPSLFFGVQRVWALHWEQMDVVANDLSNRHLLDISSTLARLDLAPLGIFTRYAVVATSGAVGLFCYFLIKDAKFDWPLCITFFLASFLLLVPRVESPTFVLIAPGYLFMMRLARGWQRLWMGSSMFLVTFVYTSAWPALFRLPLQEMWASKAIGTLMIWVTCLYFLLRRTEPTEESSLILPRKLGVAHA